MGLGASVGPGFPGLIFSTPYYYSQTNSIDKLSAEEHDRLQESRTEGTSITVEIRNSSTPLVLLPWWPKNVFKGANGQ